MKATWQGMLKRNASDADARLLVALGGRSPSDTVRKIKARVKDATITCAAATAALEACNRYAAVHGRGALVDMRDPGDWEPLPGGWRGRKHVEVDINDHERRQRV